MTDVLALRGFSQELVESGVIEVIVCPGSTSGPPRTSRWASLVLPAARSPSS
jgi:hypothetical protein